MINTATAWIELLKLGNISKIRQDIDTFWRGNIIKVLKKENFFEYIKEPRSIDEILEQFKYTDKSFLELLLGILVDDKTLTFHKNKYRLKGHLNTDWVLPSVFDERMKDLWCDFASFIPNRLKGQYMNFSEGFNLFNWDNVLSNKMYTQIRKSAFSYVKNFKNNTLLLDVGSGNGYGTASIWVDFVSRKNTNKIKITGIEPDNSLLEISKKEFLRMVKKITSWSNDKINENKDFFPEFVKGTALNIPFDNDTFDYVYASQILHWTDAEKAVNEMIRVTKKGGIVFGTQNFTPVANPFNDLHFKVIEGAKGFFSKKELENWVLNSGAQKVKFSTPISIFLIKN